uniref:Uncharacterized protein n=1 Tax=Arundo donax TaxID=35708 RepID=A0A0A9DQH6_ARUDO
MTKTVMPEVSGDGDAGSVGEARIEATQKGENELRVLHRMADVAKSGGLGLQPLAVRRDGAIALHHGVEFVEEENGARLPVGMEDPLNGHPQIAGGWIGVVHGEVEDGVVNGAGDPAPDAALRGIPLRIIRSRGSRAIDVRAKAELAAQ